MKPHPFNLHKVSAAILALATFAAAPALAITTIAYNDSIILSADTDQLQPGSEYLAIDVSGVTPFYTTSDHTYLQAATTDVDGTLNVYGNIVSNGINNGGDGISNAGSISGVNNLTSTGSTTLGNATNDQTTVSGNLDVDNGLDVIGGITNNNNGITSVGAITGATSITAAGFSNLILNTASDAAIKVNTDGLTANESFIVDVGGSGGAAVPSTITTIQSNENSTVLTNSAASLTVGGASQANAISLNSAVNNLVAATSNTMSVTGGSAVTTTATQVKALTADGRGLTVTNGGAVSLTGVSSAGLNVDAAGDTVTLLNDVNGGHGLTIDAAVTTLTGGTHSSSLTLQDASATLAVGTASSGEVQVINATNVGGVTSVAIGGATDSSNLIEANATTGTNDIEAKYNYMGVNTANSVNTIGNAGTSVNTVTGLSNNMTATASNTLMAPMTVIGDKPTYNESSDAIEVVDGSGVSIKSVVDEYGDGGDITLNAERNTVSAGTSNLIESDHTNTIYAADLNTITSDGDNAIYAANTNTIASGISNTLSSNLNVMGNGINYADSTDAIRVTGGTGVDIKGGDNTMTADGNNRIVSGWENYLGADAYNVMEAGANAVYAYHSDEVPFSGNNLLYAEDANNLVSGYTFIGNSMVDYADATDAMQVTAGAGVDVKATDAITMTSGVSNTLNSALNVIGNGATYADATDAIQVTGGTGVDIKATSANTITSGVSNTLNSALNVIGNDATYADATDAIQVTGGTGVDIKGKDNTISAAAACDGDSCPGGSNTISADLNNNITASQNNTIVSEEGDNFIHAAAGANVMVASLGSPEPSPANAPSAKYGSIVENAGENAILADVANRIYAPLTVIGNGGGSAAEIRVVNNEGGGTVHAAVTGASVLEGGENTASAMTLINAGETGPHAEIGANGGITIAEGAAGEASASLTLTNGLGDTHGMVVTEDATVISGGTHSTSLSFADTGATFQDTYGAPVKVTGVADGKSDYDAVNFKQLKQAFSGIAGVAAMAAIPEPAQGDNFSVGMGYGHFKGANAMAVGLKGRVGDNITMSAGMGYGSSDTIIPNAGFSFSW